jgi:hypothetical protein
MEMWVFVPISAFVAIAWVIHTIVDGFRRRQQIRLATDFHGKLLDRIGSAKEFGEFLNSTGGTKFLDALTIEREGGPHTRILRALQAGFVGLALGIGLFILIGNASLTFGIPREFARDAEDGLAVLATISTSIGIGLLVSAGASYVLSRRLRLMNDGCDRRSEDPVRSA